jgi:tRNA-2-methylthio-N6-dimethylallyladenosine synthase
MKFHLVIFGCQMNYSDAARIRAVLMNCGRTPVEDREAADVVIIDTCSVRQKSEDKVRGLLKEVRADQKIRCTGCMIWHNLNLKKAKATTSKKYTTGNFLGNVESNEPTIVGLEPLSDEIRKTLSPSDEILYVNHSFDPLWRTMWESFPNTELFFRINDLGFLPFVMRKLWYEVSPDIDVVNEYTWIIPHNANMLFAENTQTAYVPISTWCSQFCAYCIVPYARGLEKNRDKEEILKEIEAQIASGASEIVLLGQIVNKHPDFDEIVRRTCETPGVKRVRYTSPYPTFYSDTLLRLHETMENLCPHIHMPMQSGSTKVLKKMFRGYTAEQFKEFVDKIRTLSRPISITSDVIVGFCTETEEDFEETIELVRYAKFDLIYMGIYSPRPGTIAERKFEDDVPRAIKKERRHRLNEVLKEVSAKNNQTEIGTTKTVIIREITHDKIIWYSENMKQVIINVGADSIRPHASLQTGQYIRVKINSVKSFTLYGEIVE